MTYYENLVFQQGEAASVALNILVQRGEQAALAAARVYIGDGRTNAGRLKDELAG